MFGLSGFNTFVSERPHSCQRMSVLDSTSFSAFILQLCCCKHLFCVRYKYSTNNAVFAGNKPLQDVYAA